MGGHPFNAHEYDQADYDSTISSYMLCTAPRCGGTLLASLLYESDVMGVPHEYFHIEDVAENLCERWGFTRPVKTTEYFDEVLKRRTGPNGVFGLKTHFSQIYPLLGQKSVQKLLGSTKSFVHVTRKDVLAQAVSYAIAHQSRSWSTLHTTRADAQYDSGLVNQFLEEILMQSLQWQRFFTINKISAIEISYEDILEDPNRVCHQICESMDIKTAHDFSIKKSPLKQQTTTQNTEWIDRFRSEKKIF